MNNKFRNIFLKIVLVVSFVLSTSGCSAIENITQPHSNFNITFIDVGQGDSALIECDGHFMLIDGGPKSSADKVYSTLDDRNIRGLDYLVFSHLHEDHIGGLEKVLNHNIRIGKVLSNDDTGESEAFKSIKRELKLNHKKIKIPRIDATYKLGGAKVRILDSGKSNNESLILLVTYKNTKFLFTGDMPHNMEERLCNKYHNDLKVDLLKVAHHGGSNDKESNSKRFFGTVRPKYAIISVGKENGYEHPDKGVLDQLELVNCKIYRTDTDGDIFVRSNGKTISIKTEK